MSNTKARGCSFSLKNTLEEKEHLLHLRLMKAALENTDIPFLGLAEPTLCGKGTRRLHEADPGANDQQQAQTRHVEEIVMQYADLIKAQRKSDPLHSQVELPRIVQYDLFHIAESMPETRSGAHNDPFHSFFHHQEAVDTILDHCQYFLDRQGFIMLMWHAYHPVWDDWDFYRITKQTGTQEPIEWNENKMNNPFNMLHLPGSMSWSDQRKIIKRTIDGFWSSATTDTKALSFQKKLDHIADFAKALATRKGSAIFRPYHEHSGNWFWWCLDNLDADPTEAARLYRKLFHKTREYLEGQGVDNLLYCYSPDLIDNRFFANKAEFLAHYQAGMPDLDQLDVLGIDAYLWKLYYGEDMQEYADASGIEDKSARRQRYHSILARPWERALQMCTWLREEYPDKIVGLTETGWDYKRWGQLGGRPIETFWHNVGMQRLQALPKNKRPHFINFWRNDVDNFFTPWDNGADRFAKEAVALAQGMDTQVADVPPGSVIV